MLSLIRPEAKLIYGIHDSIGLHCLFQLRVSLSSLRSHKRRHNFIDTPSDICHCNQGIEDTNHFLFSCPTYVNQRAALVIGVNEILRENNLSNVFNFFLYMHFCSGTMTTHAQSINSDLQRGLERRLRHTQH